MHLKRLAAIALAFALAGCMRGEHEAFAYSSGVHPMYADPADLVATVDLPEGLELAPRGLILEFNGARTDSQEVIAGWYPMVRRGEVYRMRGDDIVALRKLQRVIRLWRSEAPERALARITLLVKGCPTGAGPDPAAKVRVRLSGDGGTRYRTIDRNRTAIDVLTTKAGPPGVFGPPC